MRGFTLIETLVAISIFVLALLAIVALTLAAYRAQGFGFQQAQTIEEAKRGLKIMIGEIREAQLGEDGAYIIEKAEGNEFVFYANVDEDEQIERVSYFLQDSVLAKGVTNPTGQPAIYNTQQDQVVSTVSAYIVNGPTIFRYFDGTNQELASPANLQETKLMRVAITINADPAQGPGGLTLESDVQIRNLKTN